MQACQQMIQLTIHIINILRNNLCMNTATAHLKESCIITVKLFDVILYDVILRQLMMYHFVLTTYSKVK